MDASAQPATTRSASLEDFKSINDNVVSRDETDVLQKKKARGVIDVFLGRNRDESKTQNEPVVWTPSGFFPSVGRRLEGVFTKRFLYVYVPTSRDDLILTLLRWQALRVAWPTLIILFDRDFGRYDSTWFA